LDLGGRDLVRQKRAHGLDPGGQQASAAQTLSEVQVVGGLSEGGGEALQHVARGLRPPSLVGLLWQRVEHDQGEGAEVVLESLELVDFRNFTRLALDFPPGLNLLVGENAQGKTGFLEALYLLGALRSFRASREIEMLAWGGDGARVNARFGRSQGGSRDLELRWVRRPDGSLERTVLKNRLPVRRMAEFLGEVPLALFTPGDLALVQGAPQGRRRFLDLLLCKISPAYLSALARLQTVLRQRNELLRRRPAPTSAELEPWDQQLSSTAAILVPRRQAAVVRLQEVASDLFRRLSDGGSELALTYRPGSPANQEEVLEALVQGRREDLRRGTTTLGPHRDDLELRLADRSLRRFGSQGQQRSAALALRLAEARVVGEGHGEGALVLLDDCFSELDPGRRERLVEILGGWPQVFLTATSLPGDPPPGATSWQVVSGTLRRLGSEAPGR